ncbi:MAG: hypothetical protein GX610_01720 [Rhodococcus sp.]|nr:hypothetical protein [Rhodococcus sp. (in: high G+C Gram-positive bacteria)]
MIGAAVGIIIALAFVAGPRLYRRWDVSRRAERAPSEHDQANTVTAQFNGQPLVLVDPRDFTISVGHMNAIANQFGYYYIGEKGTPYGSTEVAFQRLPSPPPLPVPRKAASWSAYVPPVR